MELLTPSKRVIRWVVFGMMVIGLLTAEPVYLAAASGKTINEDQLSDLHAALVLKIAKFVQWPVGSPEELDGKILLGFVGDEAVVHSFGLLADKKIMGQGIELVQVQNLEQLPPCKILFLSREQSFAVQSWPGVLTIGDSPDFHAQGGMIRLSIENGRPRFSINLNAAEAAGISFSSKLLKIAIIDQGEVQ